MKSSLPRGFWVVDSTALGLTVLRTGSDMKVPQEFWDIFQRLWESVHPAPQGVTEDQAGKIPMKPGQQDPLAFQLNDVNEAEHVGGYPESQHPKAKVELLQSLGYTMRRGSEIKID